MADEENKELEHIEKPEGEIDKRDKKQPDPVPYDRFKEVNDKAATLEKELQKIKEKEKQDADKKLADEKKWEELAKSKDVELKEKESELARLRIAAKKGIPVDLIDRLKGTTEEEIEADADKLLEFLKVDDSRGVPPHKKGGSNTRLDISSMTPEEIRKNSKEIVSQGTLK